MNMWWEIILKVFPMDIMMVFHLSSRISFSIEVEQSDGHQLRQRRPWEKNTIGSFLLSPGVFPYQKIHFHIWRKIFSQRNPDVLMTHMAQLAKRMFTILDVRKMISYSSIKYHRRERCQYKSIVEVDGIRSGASIRKNFIKSEKKAWQNVSSLL
jgi:hypothetical protein